MLALIFKNLINLKVILCILSLYSAQAGLGESAPSVKKDQKFLKGHSQCYLQKPYSFCEIITPFLHFREYIDPQSQIIYALSWEGSRHPPLARLLGMYYPSLKALLEAPTSFSASRYLPQRIGTAEVQLVRSGWFQHIKGKAYLKSFLLNNPQLETEIE